MINKSLSEIEQIYELELEKVFNEIKKQKRKTGSKSKDFESYKVLLQFPEGMKPYSTVIAKEIEDKTNCQCLIWLGSCFGGCDVPVEAEKLGIDLIIQFGHSKWGFKDKKVKVL